MPLAELAGRAMGAEFFFGLATLKIPHMQHALELNPARWSGKTRNWTPIGAVTLNPECDSIIKSHSGYIDRQPLAA